MNRPMLMPICFLSLQNGLGLIIIAKELDSDTDRGTLSDEMPNYAFVPLCAVGRVILNFLFTFCS